MTVPPGPPAFPPPDPERVEQAVTAMHERRARLRRARIAGISALALAIAIAVAASVASSPGRNTLHVAGRSETTSTTTASTSAPSTSAPPGSSVACPFGSGTSEPSVETTPTTADAPGLLHATVVDSNGNPVAGIGVWYWPNLIGPELIRTDTQGQFQLTCAPMPYGSRGIPILVSPWQPTVVTGLAHEGDGAGDPTSVAPTLGWTYAATSGPYTGGYDHAPSCDALPDPLRLVLPPAGFLDVTVQDPDGNLMPATDVSLWTPGLKEGEVFQVLAWDGEGIHYGGGRVEDLMHYEARVDDFQRYWRATTDAAGTASFPSLSANGFGYSVWVGNLLTTCSLVNVAAGSTTSVTCKVIPPDASTPSTTTTSASGP